MDFIIFAVVKVTQQEVFIMDEVTSRSIALRRHDGVLIGLTWSNHRASMKTGSNAFCWSTFVAIQDSCHLVYLVSAAAQYANSNSLAQSIQKACCLDKLASVT